MVQGFGLNFSGASFDYSRELSQKGAENIVNFTFMNGLLSFDWNITNDILFIGFMPSGRFALGAGVQGYLKAGFTKSTK